MKRAIKRVISLAMCAVLLLGVMSVSAFAISAEDYTNLPYECYTYIGDSISWGYGLDPSIDTKVESSVCRRVDGAFTDLVGKVLEENNGAVVHSASSSGARLCDFRMLLERGMGVEDPYTYPDDWFGSRSPVRTQTLRNKGADICNWVSESDLVTVQSGINDLTGILVNSLCASGLIDLDKLTSISDVNSVVDYLVTALGNLKESPNVLANVIIAFNREVKSMRENASEVVKDVVALAPDDADIVLVGYHNAAACFRVIPGSDYSPIFDFVNAALVSLNDYLAEVASRYDNVYFVAAPDASTFYADGMLITDALANASDILRGLHPDAAGHEYIAECVLDGLKEINTCHHTNTKTLSETIQTKNGFGYVSSTVCTDCGKVLDMGKIITPAGSVNVPANTISYTINTIAGNITATATRLFNGIASIFGK